MTDASDPLAQLADHGVSIWLDDLSRELLAGGQLQNLIDERHVVGVTTNPTIFASALAKGERYTDQLRDLADQHASVDDAIFAITTDDVRTACDLFAPVFESTHHVDGRVSIEVDPRLARDTDATVTAAKALSDTVGRPNMLVKIPATEQGLPAITAAIAAGISVNVTLIFSLQRYRDVIDAYLTGLEQAQHAGVPLGEIYSVASFFVSRVDTDIDTRLDHLDTDRAHALKGQAGLANARLAYQLHHQTLGTERWHQLADAGANPQRPLWASTGVKDPAYPDTLYVEGLVATGTVNTMPGATLEAFAEHGEIVGDTITDTYPEAQAHLDALAELGIDYTEVTNDLETQGLEKFAASWDELTTTVQHESTKATK
jgi:transaldolase